MRQHRTVTFKHVIMINLATIVILASIFFAYQVIAVPNSEEKALSDSIDVLSYQGSLVDSNGDPISGTFDMSFRFYGDIDGTNQCWIETHVGENAVPVDSGLFDVTLGRLNPIPASVWNESELYLGIQIGEDDEMRPLEEINLLPPQIAPNSLDADVLLNGSISYQKLGEDVNIPVIQSGWVTRGTTSPGWNLREGDGTREFIVHITFPEPFTEIPDVIVSLLMADISKDFNTRVWVLARDVTTTGFDLVMRTWSDTYVNGVGATWIAIQD